MPACDDVPGTGAAAGIDMGAASVITTSDGTRVAPAPPGTFAGRLANS